MSHPVKQTNQELRDAAARLVREWHDLPPGSVLRSFSRAVRAALLAGCPPLLLAAEAEQLARDHLTHRVTGPTLHAHGDASSHVPSVPRPRRDT